MKLRRLLPLLSALLLPALLFGGGGPPISSGDEEESSEPAEESVGSPERKSSGPAFPVRLLAFPAHLTRVRV